MRLVLVEWEDSHAAGGWQEISGEIADRALLCRSVGWLLLDGEHAKVVAPHLNVPEPDVALQACGTMTIPTRAVLRITDITQHGSGITCPSSCSESA